MSTVRLFEPGEAVEYLDRATFTAPRWVTGTARVFESMNGPVVVIDTPDGAVLPEPDDVRPVEVAA